MVDKLKQFIEMLADGIKDGNHYVESFSPEPNLYLAVFDKVGNTIAVIDENNVSIEHTVSRSYATNIELPYACVQASIDALADVAAKRVAFQMENALEGAIADLSAGRQV